MKIPTGSAGMMLLIIHNVKSAGTSQQMEREKS
jgi:hypothetical protein